MKFTCSQQVLSKALNTVSKAVSTRTTLPVLKGILIEAAQDGTLTMTASDLDISIQKKVNEVIADIMFGEGMKTNDEIAVEVIQGKWGNGEKRRALLTAEGYNYEDIQKIVNRMLS